MMVFPAVDLKNGRCVRLRQGRAAEATVYGDDPVEMARRWADEGAEALHVVDLDGAFEGAPRHADVIAAMIRACGLRVQVGGGLRSDEHVRRMLDAGAWRVILGTRALSRPDDVGALVARYGEKIVVGIDARDGRVQTRGWVESSEVSALDLARMADGWGVGAIVYTDTATDGMLSGPNLRGVCEMAAAVRCDIVASGGISDAADVSRLARLALENLSGVIVGQALYAGRVSLPELHAAANSVSG